METALSRRGMGSGRNRGRGRGTTASSGSRSQTTSVPAKMPTGTIEFLEWLVKHDRKMSKWVSQAMDAWPDYRVYKAGQVLTVAQHEAEVQRSIAGAIDASATGESGGDQQPSAVESITTVPGHQHSSDDATASEQAKSVEATAEELLDSLPNIHNAIQRYMHKLFRLIASLPSWTHANYDELRHGVAEMLRPLLLGFPTSLQYLLWQALGKELEDMFIAYEEALKKALDTMPAAQTRIESVTTKYLWSRLNTAQRLVGGLSAAPTTDEVSHVVDTAVPMDE